MSIVLLLIAGIISCPQSCNAFATEIPAANQNPGFEKTSKHAIQGYDLNTFKARAHMLIDSMASWAASMSIDEFKNSDDFNGGKYGAYPIMALFKTGHIEKAREFASRQLVGGGAMFREFSTMALYMEYKDMYGEDLRQKVKKDQLNSDFFREDKTGRDGLGGASENHKLMYAAAGYLAGQEWPEDYPERWVEISREALLEWFEEVISVGFWEQDSPTYLIHHLGPILSVADHGPEGSEMKRKATMVLDWYFASLAGEYLHGYWITATARDYDPLYGLARSAETTALMWLVFGDAPQVPFPHVYQPMRHWKATIHFAVSDYRVPEILRAIATDRDEPYVHREFMARNPMKPKEYNYITPHYGVASILGEGENIPPDMTRWKVQWVAEQADQEPSVFFMKHPKPDEENWKDWQGASPYEQVLQYQADLVAVYHIPGDDAHPFIDGPFNRDAYKVIRQQEGWWFLHTGSVLMGLRAVNGIDLMDEKRIDEDFGGRPAGTVSVVRSNGRKNGLIVETAAVSEYAGGSPEEELQHFAETVLEETHIETTGMDEGQPALQYTSLEGNKLAIKYDTYKKINGGHVDLSDWPLLENPWMHQEFHKKKLIIKWKDDKRVYDFKNWSVD